MVDVQRGREEVAESSLRQAVSVGPDVAGYRVALATFLTARGRNDEAALELMRGVEACPGEPQLRLLLGSALVRCRRLDEAERVLLRARPLLPDDVHDIDLLLAEVDAYRKS
jgi:Flp pilus assembly protein TadD